ncbi:MAG: FecR family protein [Treponema sp.]|jgi:hypothetical protein|nr:FecR family protein [Treponema sp.]
MKGFVVALMILSSGLLRAQEAYIRELSGTVEVQAPGAAVWTAAETGQRITGDTRISTGFKSIASIVLGNSTLMVRPLTRLSLDELRNIQGNEEVRLYLQSGRIRVNVKPPVGGKTGFTVRSPMITASVRGTSFTFDGVNLQVDEGQVHAAGEDGGGVYVGTGHRTVSDPETGRAAGGMETAREDLTPDLPAGAAGTMPEPAAIIPQAADYGFGFRWD